MPAIMKLTIWNFVFDDFMDELAHMGADIGASQEMVDAIMRVFHHSTVVVQAGDLVGDGIKKGMEYGGNGDYGSAIWLICESTCD